MRELRRAFEDFKHRHAEWLERDALYDALRREHGGAAWESWGGPGAALDSRLWNPRPGEAAACETRREELRSRHAAEMEFYRFAQFLAHDQHRSFREEVRRLGLRLYGDLQVGLSRQDAWSYDALFLRSYVMGAPPSGSNPEGQAWHYPVLDPAQYGELANPGPAMRLVQARLDKMFAEFDAVRIDHPHGLVCPWVYRPEADGFGARGAARGAALLLARSPRPPRACAIRHRPARAAEPRSGDAAPRGRLGGGARARTGGSLRAALRRRRRVGAPKRASHVGPGLRGAEYDAVSAPARAAAARTGTLPRDPEGRPPQTGQRVPQRERRARRLADGRQPRHQAPVAAHRGVGGERRDP